MKREMEREVERDGERERERETHTNTHTRARVHRARRRRGVDASDGLSLAVAGSCPRNNRLYRVSESTRYPNLSLSVSESCRESESIRYPSL